MKVFISWSGERSKALAQALHKWLPMVLQYVEPWVSESDIAAGDRWAEAVSSELEASNFGIICITPENLSSEWILFEAGALSKSMQDAKVIPLLFDLDFSDVSGPLAQFQAKKADLTGLNEIINAINKASENKADENIVKELVPALWPKLKQLIDGIPDKKSSDKHSRTQKEILEELVTGFRGLDNRLRDFENIDVVSRHEKKKYKKHFPVIFDELQFFIKHEDDVTTSLLLLSGFLRDDLPWLSEILTESYRELTQGNKTIAKKALRRLEMLPAALERNIMMSDLYTTKEMHYVYAELPRIISHLVSSISRHYNEKPTKGVRL